MNQASLIQEEVYGNYSSFYLLSSKSQLLEKEETMLFRFSGNF